MKDKQREKEALRVIKRATGKLLDIKDLSVLDFLDTYDRKILDFEEIVLLSTYLSAPNKLKSFVNNKIYIDCMNAVKKMPQNEKIEFERDFIKRYQFKINLALFVFEKKLVVSEAENIINSTPYTILGMEESNYSKEELNDILAKAINSIKKEEIGKVEQEKKIDEALDAYNQILKKL